MQFVAFGQVGWHKQVSSHQKQQVKPVYQAMPGDAKDERNKTQTGGTDDTRGSNLTWESRKQGQNEFLEER